MAYSLVIKGSAEDARRKCAEYDLVRAGVPRETSAGEQVQIVLDDSDDVLARLQRWTAEDLGRSAPYPPGALLLFTEVALSASGTHYITASGVARGL